MIIPVVSGIIVMVVLFTAIYREENLKELLNFEQEKYKRAMVLNGDLKECRRLTADAGMRLVIENIELNNTIDMLAEAEVAALYPKEVNE